VLGGITVINAALQRDGSIQQSQVRINMNHLGELDRKKSARSMAIAQALTTGGLPVEVVDDISVSMWQKFFGYACNATLTTLTRSRAGAIARAGAGAGGSLGCDPAPVRAAPNK